MEYSEILNKVKEIIINFLANQGGRENGYMTYINGVCKSNSFKALDWMTPAAKDLTLSQHKTLGYKICDRINQYLREINFEEEIVIASIPIDYDCYKVIIGINLTEYIMPGEFKER